MDNHIYDLVQSLGEKGESIWAYEKYIEDSADCSHCLSVWKKIKEDDQKHIDDLKSMIQKHVEEKTF